MAIDEAAYTDPVNLLCLRLVTTRASSRRHLRLLVYPAIRDL
jgi:hypothetical protein